MYDVIHPQFAPNGAGQILAQEYDRLMAAWRSFDVRAQLLIGTFDDDGLALLYLIGRVEGVDGLVHLCEFPGHSAIGAGFYNADMWLNYRQQTLGLSVAQSGLHAYEASRLASSAPSVNKDIEILVATKESHFHLSSEAPSIANCPISLPWLKQMAKKYGPRSTNDLGFGAHPSKPKSSSKAHT
jgi:hypothetical protein